MFDIKYFTFLQSDQYILITLDLKSTTFIFKEEEQKRETIFTVSNNNRDNEPTPLLGFCQSHQLAFGPKISVLVHVGLYGNLFGILLLNLMLIAWARLESVLLSTSQFITCWSSVASSAALPLGIGFRMWKLKPRPWGKVFSELLRAVLCFVCI